ncbi:uncharacterized protein EAF01_009585 [Botrytis porri]|uniref:uncharacterized protein n=1 Tax=Botrytis porri TaxID=87229 RepID=UPI001901D86C|nr:uncharacterized protein EAF01_009585 [Botrytis porri]KAF7895623.1 hypothetical protein EAF01_009585 [Botrytis porri]
MFNVHERGRMLAVYLFAQQLGSISPFHALGLISGGSIADGPGWRWSQYIVGIIYGVSDDTTTYWNYFKRPFSLWSFPTAVIPGFIFAFGCTAWIVSFNTVSEIFSSDPHDFSSTTDVLLCFATLIKSTIGLLTGVLSDHIVIFLARRNKGVKEPEMRLWTLTASFVYAAVGYLLYGWVAQT